MTGYPKKVLEANSFDGGHHDNYVERRDRWRLRKSRVSRIHLLNRMTEDDRVIHTLHPSAFD